MFYGRFIDFALQRVLFFNFPKDNRCCNKSAIWHSDNFQFADNSRGDLYKLALAQYMGCIDQSV